MEDRLVKVTAAAESVLAVAACTTGVVEEARRRHGTYPTATAALGRLLTAGLLLGSTVKDRERLSLEICCEGPLKRIMVTTTGKGQVRGFVAQPFTDLPLRSGKLDVGGAIGSGILCVIRTHPSDRESYRSITKLVSGEVGKDITYYLATSAQIPSSVGLGVFVAADGRVGAAGGFMIQMLPGAEESAASAIEQNVASIGSVSRLVRNGMGPVEILALLLRGFEFTLREEFPVRFACGCDRDRVLGALAALGAEDLKGLVQEGKGADVKCEFCGALYQIGGDEVTLLLSEPQGRS